MNNIFEIFNLINAPDFDLKSRNSVNFLPTGCVCVIRKSYFGDYSLLAVCSSWTEALQLCYGAEKNTIALCRRGSMLYQSSDFGLYGDVDDSSGFDNLLKAFTKTGLMALKSHTYKEYKNL